VARKPPIRGQDRDTVLQPGTPPETEAGSRTAPTTIAQAESPDHARWADTIIWISLPLITIPVAEEASRLDISTSKIAPHVRPQYESVFGLVRLVLDHGKLKKSRTGVDTILILVRITPSILRRVSPPDHQGVNWTAMLRELLWYSPARTHSQPSSAHEDLGRLGDAMHLERLWRYWRRFPSRASTQRHGSAGDRSNPIRDRYVTQELKSPHGRHRMGTGNAETSKLPPCITVSSSTSRATASTATSPTFGDIALGIRSIWRAMHADADDRSGSRLDVGFFSHTSSMRMSTPITESGFRNTPRPGLREQLRREPRPLPRLVIARSLRSTPIRGFSVARLSAPPKIKFKVAYENPAQQPVENLPPVVRRSMSASRTFLSDFAPQPPLQSVFSRLLTAHPSSFIANAIHSFRAQSESHERSESRVGIN